VSASQPVPVVDQLGERDQAVLTFERRWWKYSGSKEQAIRTVLGMSTTHYYQVLNALLDSPSAFAFDPVLIKRLRRLRGQRQRQRGERRLDPLSLKQPSFEADPS
jgi:hypothetical protein